MPDLLDDAVVHDDDPVGHGHRFDLVVRHVDAGRSQPAMQLANLAAHLDAQLRVEIRQRLVEQEDLRISNDRPAHRDALPLAARELSRPPVEELPDPQDPGRPIRPAPPVPAS